jgi:hypothetical protein
MSRIPAGISRPFLSFGFPRILVSHFGSPGALAVVAECAHRSSEWRIVVGRSVEARWVGRGEAA